jgi:uncharacterized membrane protein
MENNINLNNKQNSIQNRFPELDILKGIAVIMMVIFHFYYLYYILGKDFTATNNPFISNLATISHTIFIILFGVNFSINYKKNKYKSDYYKKQLKRFGIYSVIAIAISAITYNMFPHKFVIFGIFHFFAAALIMANLFAGKTKTIIGLILFTILQFSIQFSKGTIPSKCYDIPLFCFISGIGNVNYQSIDHFPFIQFFIKVLLGMFIGDNLYDIQNRNIDLSQLDTYFKKSTLLKSIAYLGKHSLSIYIIHWILLYSHVKLTE